MSRKLAERVLKLENKNSPNEANINIDGHVILLSQLKEILHCIDGKTAGLPKVCL